MLSKPNWAKALPLPRNILSRIPFPKDKRGPKWVFAPELMNPSAASAPDVRSRPVNPAHEGLAGRVSLREKISAAHASGAPREAARKEVVAPFRSALDEGRAAIREAFYAEHRGLRWRSRPALLEDDIIEEIYSYVAANVQPASE